jgi:hypothetical protein
MQNIYGMVLKDLGLDNGDTVDLSGLKGMSPVDITIMAFAYLSGKTESFLPTRTGKGKPIKGNAFKSNKEDLDPFNDLIVG